MAVTVESIQWRTQPAWLIRSTTLHAVVMQTGAHLAAIYATGEICAVSRRCVIVVNHVE